MSFEAYQEALSSPRSSKRARSRLLVAAAGLDELSPAQKRALVIIAGGYLYCHEFSKLWIAYGMMHGEKVPRSTLRALERRGLIAYESGARASRVYVTLTGAVAAALLQATGEFE